MLAGPGEGWTVNEQGAIVGQTTGRPVIKLEDLLVALQATRAARETGISCSIDPTEEGVRAMREYVSRQRTFTPGGLGRHCPEHWGRNKSRSPACPTPRTSPACLVAADYRMKRIGMQLEDSPLPELPSFLQIAGAEPV